jgi:threonine/homoserine/homoserine lactone efflux protein
MSFINLLPALGFLILNVFVPGPNVLNTIATAIGSGYRTGLACAVACGVGILLWATAALFGAAVFFQQYPLANKSLVIIGGVLLLYFSFKYIKRSLNRNEELVSIQNQSYNSAFWQALLVMLAVISLFPIITDGLQNILSFIILSALASFLGHAIFATLFSSKAASIIYLSLYRPINGIVGIGFCFYGLKLLTGIT